jgi:hypothetical protein
MYQAGGTWMALWIGFCSLAGILISVVRQASSLTQNRN